MLDLTLPTYTQTYRQTDAHVPVLTGVVMVGESVGGVGEISAARTADVAASTWK